MGRKLNCWEFKNCGRQPGGHFEKKLGTCSAATQKLADRIHDGINGGRACWAIAGTLCGGRPQGSFSSKISGCMDCDFYQAVCKEEVVVKDTVDILFEIGYKVK